MKVNHKFFAAGMAALMVFASIVGLGLPFGVRAQSPRPILVTAYRQMGWGDGIQVGYVDEEGGLWFTKGQDHEMRWPGEAADQLAWIAACGTFTSIGELEHDDLFALESLVECVENQPEDSAPAANDAGTQMSYAVRYSRDGEEVVLLGESGDTRFENTDPSAQALYRFLCQSFPDVTSYFGNPTMAPKGFQAVSLPEFCGYADADLSGLRVVQTQVDCEAGPASVELSQAEAAQVLARILSLRVTGKQSCLVTTGGSTIYEFLDPAGGQAARFEFYQGLLVTEDGMYALED